MIQSPNISLLGQQINWASPQAQGLVASWPLNDGGGTVARDLVGRRHGTLTNFPANPWTVSPFGRALTFDGSDDYLANCEIGNEFAFANTTFTVSFFFNTTTGGMIFAKDGSPTGNGYFTYVIAASGLIATQFKGGGTTAFNNTSTRTVMDGKWHHYCAVITTSTSSYLLNNALCYIDGVLDSGTVAKTGVYVSPSVAFTIGKRNGTIFYGGKLADFRIYNRALSASEAQDIYVNPLGLYVPRKIQFMVPNSNIWVPKVMWWD